jgi:hypothetical protein
MRPPRPPFPLHRRAPPDLAVPPSVPVLWPQHVCSFSQHLEDGLPDCYLLRHGGRLALLVTPRHALELVPVQEHPQDPSPVLGSVRSGC